MLKMLNLENIIKIYKKNSKSPISALNGVTISLPTKGLVFIVGESGSGKTTLLNIIGGIDSPTSGKVIYGNKVISKLSMREMNNYRNEKVGFVFQEYNLLSEYSVGKNVGLSLELQGTKPTKEVVDIYLKKLNLVDTSGETLFHRPVKELSGGQKQRVAIARALIKNPDIILADEPTGALDPGTSEGLYEVLKDISLNKLVIIVSHDIQSASKYGDRIIEIADGLVKSDSAPLQCGTKEETLSSESGIDVKNRKKFRLSNSIAFKISLSSIKSKPLRYLMSLITAIVSCSLFCFSSVASTTDLLTSELQSCYKNNVKTVILKQNSTISVLTKYEDGKENRYIDSIETGLTDKQLELLSLNKEVNTLKTAKASYFCENFGANYFGKDISEEELYNPYNYLAVCGINRLVEVGSEKEANDIFLTPDERIGDASRMPQNYAEIAITDYWADMFMRFGYKDQEGNVSQINNVNELIGKKIDRDLTICGIYKTDEDKTFLEKYDKNQRAVMDDFLNLYLGGEHIMNYAFVYKGFFKNGIDFDVPIDALYKLKGNLYADKKVIKTVSYTYDQIYENLRSIDYCTYNISATFTTRYAQFETAYSFFTDPITIRVFVIASFILCFLAALILFNSLISSLNEKKREFGILRALGASGIGVIKIFLFEALLFSLVNFIISFVFCEIACAIINNKFFFCLFNLGPIPFLLLFGMVVVIAILGSVIPMISLANKKPVDIIREN